ALAIHARIGDHFAGAAAGRAAALDDEETLLRADLARAAAGLAALGAIIVLGTAAAMALLASGHRLHRDRLLYADESFLEAQLEIIAQVGAARGILLRAWIHELAENGREDVRKAVETSFGERIAAAPAVLERCLAEPVVSGTLLRILEDVIGFVDRF